MPDQRRDTSAHRAIALAGWFVAVVGLVGIVVAPRLLLLWVIILAFGVATLPRAFIEWRREHRGRPPR